ncbi:hypothetical protein OROGR_013394 [Orobanche gracilis]
MGGATRFMTFLFFPRPPLRPPFILPHRRLSSLSVAPLRFLALSSPSKIKIAIPQLVSSFHSQPTNTVRTIQYSAAQHQQNHPWPEWTNFLNVLSTGQGLPAPENHGIPPDDAFVVYEKLSDDFVRAAAACIAFARARPSLLGLLSRRDIEAVVSNGTPFLFKSALGTARRMRAFLETDGRNVLELDKAYTIDLMKYILSYTSNPIISSERKGLYSRGLVDSSIRNLLHELGTVCSGVPTGYVPASRQTQNPFGQNIEMKRGDWICRKCNFMNFAKNMKCLECDEARSKKQLNGGEWECPQCNFFNYGRNLVCLRCDCRRPGAPLFNNNTSQSNSGYIGNFSTKTNTDTKLADNEQKAQRWFSKIPQPNREKKEQAESPEGETENFQFPKDPPSKIGIHDRKQEQAEKSERWFKKMAELHDVKDLSSAVSDEDFPEITPMRKDEDRFVVSKKNDHSFTSLKHKRQVAMDQANGTDFVPFVPFPPGYFARKDDTKHSNGQGSPIEPETQPINSENPNYPSGDVGPTSRRTWTDGKASMTENGGPMSRLSANENVRSDWTGKSLEGSGVKEPDSLDMSEEAKAERWFKRVAQINDISELSQIPDEDFPSIMPMRKGVNRFVVSKRKTPLERRLTSQQSRRNLPMVSSESVKKESDCE